MWNRFCIAIGHWTCTTVPGLSACSHFDWIIARSGWFVRSERHQGLKYAYRSAIGLWRLISQQSDGAENINHVILIELLRPLHLLVSTYDRINMVTEYVPIWQQVHNAAVVLLRRIALLVISFILLAICSFCPATTTLSYHRGIMSAFSTTSYYPFNSEAPAYFKNTQTNNYLDGE
jgi:hypothetical protein